jgi:hypothetical protein
MIGNMIGKPSLAVLAVTAALGVLGATSTAWSSMIEGDRATNGGFVKPCSLDGVNPVHHPEIFGNPAAARTFGFVLGPDRAWRVMANCRIK